MCGSTVPMCGSAAWRGKHRTRTALGAAYRASRGALKRRGADKVGLAGGTSRRRQAVGGDRGAGVRGQSPRNTARSAVPGPGGARHAAEPHIGAAGRGGWGKRPRAAATPPPAKGYAS
ncbi:hypothetical protein GCM10010271_56600 [Streptomyces kurssanovii]|nr:hypothetical protein GCM10010271_56600 [Streptomyces kurssanovii]